MSDTLLGNLCVATVNGTSFYALPPGTLRALVAQLLVAKSVEMVEDVILHATGSSSQCQGLGMEDETVCLLRRRSSVASSYLLRHLTRDGTPIFHESLPVRSERAAVYRAVAEITIESGARAHLQEIQAACNVLGAKVAAFAGDSIHKSL